VASLRPFEVLPRRTNGDLILCVSHKCVCDPALTENCTGRLRGILKIRPEFNPLNLVLFQTGQFSFIYPSISKQDSERFEKDGISVIEKPASLESFLRQIVTESPKVGWSRSIGDHLLRLSFDGGALPGICLVEYFSCDLLFAGRLRDALNEMLGRVHRFPTGN